MSDTLKAGASQVDISPKDSQFLYGYPHVERYSTGIHDRIQSSSLYLNDGEHEVLFIANDIIYLTKKVTDEVKEIIEKQTGISKRNIVITATHTHSGPSVSKHLNNRADKAVPEPDAGYVSFLKEMIVKSAVNACKSIASAELGFSVADSTGIGTNRRDPEGVSDHQVPVMVVRNSQTKEYIACMLVCSMHPTVLHEDSTLVSGDFPGMSRKYLQETVFGKDCPVLHHTGPAGNQSPRHITKANTFEEAIRLGEMLGRSVKSAILSVKYKRDMNISLKSKVLDDLPRKVFPSVELSELKLANAVDTLSELRKKNASKQQIRTAECDWFGAEESLTLSKAAIDGSLEEAYKNLLPVTIHLVSIGNYNFVFWPGEIFVEYALEVKSKCPNTFVVSLANQQLQGYIVTQEAFVQGGYEASNSLFAWQTGQVFVDETLELLQTCG
ncbi:MAG: neutral/alkaline non-lysosomal ceramidase N-terminal domain-containing protein [Sedimentisphaeraceae bacterium JB056]